MLTYRLDLLNIIEDSQLGKGGVDTYQVPTIDTISEISHSSLHSVNAQAMSRIHHENLSVNTYIVVRLILIILTTKSVCKRPSVGSCVDPTLSWAINSLTRLWYCIKPREQQLIPKLSRSKAYPFLLKALRMCFVTVRVDSVESIQIATLLCQCITTFLQSDFEELSLDLEKQICWSVYGLLSASNTSPGILKVYQEHLSVSLQAVEGPCRQIGSFHADLQVPLPLLVQFTPNPYSGRLL